jgi:hypothetical protein
LSDPKILAREKHIFEILLKLLEENKEKIQENRDYLILARLLFMCLNNCIVDNSKSQVNLINKKEMLFR